MATIGSLHTQKTFMQAIAEAYRAIGANFQVVNNTTLNNILGLPNPVGVPAAGEYPKMQYLVLGRGGSFTEQVVTPNGGTIDVANIYQHQANHAKPFDMVPLLAIPKSDPNPHPSGYRLRVEETYNGFAYWVYYAMNVDILSTSPELDVITVSNGAITSSVAYNPDDPTTIEEMTNPQPQEYQSVDLNILNGRYLRVKVPMEVEMDNDIISRIVSACGVKYGTSSAARITELCLAQGFEYTASQIGINPYSEVGHCQVATYVINELPLQYETESVTLRFALSETFPYPEPVTIP